MSPQYEQIVIKTEKSAAKLCFKHAVELGSEEIAQYRKTLQEEENEFQAEFLKQLEAMQDSDD